jgi:hypothetical protein
MKPEHKKKNEEIEANFMNVKISGTFSKHNSKGVHPHEFLTWAPDEDSHPYTEFLFCN